MPMSLSASDLIHLVLGAGVIGCVTFLAAIRVLPGDAVIPTFLAVVGVSGAVQVGSNGIRAMVNQTAANTLVAAPAPVPVGPGA